MSYLQMWLSSILAGQTHLNNFGRGHNEEYSRRTMFNLDQWFRRIYRLKKHLCKIIKILAYNSGKNVI